MIAPTWLRTIAPTPKPKAQISASEAATPA
jgi:hypothetical protein